MDEGLTNPLDVIRMMVALLDLHPNDTICDIITTKTTQFNYPIFLAS